ncbi:Maf family protein [Mucilaginibacter rivuli]|uniref:Maf family protein n=1 Tax=Mucilaginibacter rivuli TaxID=2857527 RepID=UPI0021026051|nr:Maf family nucleotide pyrophosphatase [Mucilaginibacter rivuli]
MANELMNIPSIILASKSPRRQELMKLMNINFRVVLKDVDESYPEGLTPTEIALHIAEKKCYAFDEMVDNEAVITADTIVSIGNQILGKPESPEHAVAMLQTLSGQKHQVITGVCILYKGQYNLFYDVSDVLFRTLSDDEIRFYVEKYQPMDKAGSYGIQEWIGLTGIVRIDGSYTNVVGLPTEKLYQALIKLG